jgi:hypothetical protein
VDDDTPDARLDATGVRVIRLHAQPGAGLGPAVRAALALAVAGWVPVEVEFNDRVYRCDPERMFEAIRDAADECNRAEVERAD